MYHELRPIQIDILILYFNKPLSLSHIPFLQTGLLGSFSLQELLSVQPKISLYHELYPIQIDILILYFNKPLSLSHIPLLQTGLVGSFSLQELLSVQPKISIMILIKLLLKYYIFSHSPVHGPVPQFSICVSFPGQPTPQCPGSIWWKYNYLKIYFDEWVDIYQSQISHQTCLIIPIL